MHAANEVGEYAGVGEGRREIATGTSKRERRRNCHPFSIRDFQVAAAEGVKLNVNRGLAIRIQRVIATIGPSIPTVDSGVAVSRFLHHRRPTTRWVCRGGSQTRPRYARLLADSAFHFNSIPCASFCSSSPILIFAIKLPPRRVLLDIATDIGEVVRVSNDVIVEAALPYGAS